MTVTFLCQVKQINHKLLVSGDMSTRIVLESNGISSEMGKDISNIQNNDSNRSAEVKVTLEI